jgi:methionyl aminopeptidase
MPIFIKSAHEVAKMRRTGLIVADVLDAVEEASKPGVSTWELNDVANKVMTRAGAKSAFLGYAPGGVPPYPAVLCSSRNEIVVHGIPRKDDRLTEGDILGIDFACYKDGYCADAARTFGVGRISAEARRLIDVSWEALEKGIAACAPGQHLQDIGAAVQAHAEAAGFSVVRSFCGHGIGQKMHEEPQVPNVGEKGRGLKLKPGIVLAIEPMINAGGPGIEILDDGWTVVTEDGALSAHVEHSVAVTENGPLVLTRR